MQGMNMTRAPVKPGERKCKIPGRMRLERIGGPNDPYTREE